MSPPPALAPLYTAPAPLSCVPHDVTVSVSLLSPAPPAVISSSSLYNSAKSSALPPLCPSLASSLSSWPSLSRRSSPPLFLLTCLCPCLPRSVSAVAPPCAVVAPLLVSASPHGHLIVSLFLTPYLAMLLPSSLGPLQLLAPPSAPLPPTPDTNIARGDKDLGDRKGRVVARWSVAGGSVPHGKSPIRPLTVVGDGKSRPRFLHRPQQ